MDHPSIENNRFHYLTVQSNLFMKTGRQGAARKNSPAMLELTLNAEDCSDFWGDMELREFTAMKRILDNMDRQLKQFADYVKTVNGITADYDTDGTYWAFYVNGEYAMTGVDSTPVEDGAVYAFKVEK